MRKGVIVLFLLTVVYFLSTCKQWFNAASDTVIHADYTRIDLPKTGQTFCYNDVGGVIPCPASGQDGEYQRGVQWPSPRFKDNRNGTITDRLTGLMWVKDGKLMVSRDPSFDTDSTANDGMVTWQHALDYVAKLNNEKYLGYSDWRLPNVNELQSLVDYGQSLPPGDWLNNQGFINIVSAGSYWSSSTVTRSTNNAWFMNIGYFSLAYFGGKTSNSYLLPVRSGYGSAGAVNVLATGQTVCYNEGGSVIPCSGTGQDGEYRMGVKISGTRFTDNGDGTITDRLTGLMWEKAPTGSFTWVAAYTNRINNLNSTALGGYKDWRLPNVNELRSLVHFGQSAPGTWLNTQGFSGIQVGSADNYWTGSTHSVTSELNRAWYVTFYHGGVDRIAKGGSNYVLAVRGGQ